MTSHLSAGLLLCYQTPNESTATGITWVPSLVSQCPPSPSGTHDTDCPGFRRPSVTAHLAMANLSPQLLACAWGPRRLSLKHLAVVYLPSCLTVGSPLPSPPLASRGKRPSPSPALSPPAWEMRPKQPGSAALCGPFCSAAGHP